MDSNELREAIDLVGLEVKETNDGVGTLLVRLPDRERKLRNPWFHLGPTHKPHPFLLAGVAELLTAKVLSDHRHANKYRDILWRRHGSLALFATAKQRIRAAMAVLKGAADGR